MLYKIEIRYSYSWDDAEWTDEKDGIITPVRFRTVNEAQAAIDQFFAEVKAAVVAGDIDTEEVRDDYRIVETRD